MHLQEVIFSIFFHKKLQHTICLNEKYHTQMPYRNDLYNQNKLQKEYLFKKIVVSYFILYLMNIIQVDSLLSNISEISLHMNNENDASDFFKKDHYKWEIEENEVKIEQLPQNLVEMDKFLLQVQCSTTVDDILLPDTCRWIENQGNAFEGVSEIEEPAETPKKQLKNETKNIPKNYGKAIITFMEKYKTIVKKVTQKNNVNYEDFMEGIKDRKKFINTIADLRDLWVNSQHSKCMRILSELFLRKFSLPYIFNSRICNYNSHIKYRYRLRQAVRRPSMFRHIKDY